MNIATLKSRPDLQEGSKTGEVYSQFSKLIDELRTRDLPNKVIEDINSEVDKLNDTPSDKLKNAVRKSQTRILRVVERETKVVPINYYRNLWIALGMAAFGIPIGVALGTSLGSMAYLALGLPIGMSIGIAVGTNLDKKAKTEGRQLEFDIKN
jgi:hypothetical protein